MNPYAIIAILVLLGASHTSFYFYGVSNGKNSIIAEQKKAQDVAIVKHEEVEKNDQLQAIKTEVTRQKSSVVFEKIENKLTDSVKTSPSGFTAHISDISLRLWNNANSGIEESPTSKPDDSVSRQTAGIDKN